MAEWSGWLSDHSAISASNIKLEIVFLIGVLFVYISGLSDSEEVSKKLLELWRVYIDYYQKQEMEEENDYPISVTRFGRVTVKETEKRVLSLQDFLSLKVRKIDGVK